MAPISLYLAERRVSAADGMPGLIGLDASGQRTENFGLGKNY